MQAHRRVDSIDQFRGLAILLMVLANYLAGVEWVPAWLKHAPDVGLTVIDLIAPFFIFSIGLTYGLALRHRIDKDGWPKAAWHTCRRYLVLIGLGALLSAGEIALGLNPGGIAWGVLQAIGVAGLITLLLIRLPGWMRVLSGLGLLLVYQILLENGWMAIVLASPHGGLHGSLGWAGMLLLSTALADLFHHPTHGKRWFWASCLLALVIGLVLMALWAISKNRVSASYVFVSLGASGLSFSFLAGLVDRLRLRFPLLSAWGKNPILLYLLHLLLLGVVALPGIPVWYGQAPFELVIAQIIALVGLLSLVAWQLEKRNLILSL